VKLHRPLLPRTPCCSGNVRRRWTRAWKRETEPRWRDHYRTRAHRLRALAVAMESMEKAQRRLDMARTLVEQVADDRSRAKDYPGHVLALAIREILHDEAIDAALSIAPAALAGPPEAAG
jgi:hypothetical protein